MNTSVYVADGGMSMAMRLRTVSASLPDAPQLVREGEAQPAGQSGTYHHELRTRRSKDLHDRFQLGAGLVGNHWEWQIGELLGGGFA